MFAQIIKEIVIIISLFSSVLILGCTTKDNTYIFLKTPKKSQLQPINSPDSAKLKTQKMRGKLIYQEIPPTSSVRAYRGEEFFLISNSKNQTQLVLFPSEKISRDKLKSFHNQDVEITAIYQKGTRPHAAKVACPIDNNGQCMIQSLGDQVLFIKGL